MSNYFVKTDIDRFEYQRFKTALKAFRDKKARVLIRVHDNIELVRSVDKTIEDSDA